MSNPNQSSLHTINTIKNIKRILQYGLQDQHPSLCMPLYDFLNNETGEIEEHNMSYTKLDQFKEDNPHLKQQILAAPMTVGGHGDRVKVDSGFNVVLSKIASTNIDTPMGERYHRKDTKEVKTRQIVKKHLDLQGK
jgi:hypothetical protein